MRSARHTIQKYGHEAREMILMAVSDDASFEGVMAKAIQRAEGEGQRVYGEGAWEKSMGENVDEGIEEIADLLFYWSVACELNDEAGQLALSEEDPS